MAAALRVGGRAWHWCSAPRQRMGLNPALGWLRLVVLVTWEGTMVLLLLLVAAVGLGLLVLADRCVLSPAI